LAPRAGISKVKLEAALAALAQTTTRGAFRRCAATGKIMFTTPQLAGKAARLLHQRHAGRRWDARRCGRNNHYHLIPERDTQ
jgi:hypothetical protein